MWQAQTSCLSREYCIFARPRQASPQSGCTKGVNVTETSKESTTIGRPALLLYSLPLLHLPSVHLSLVTSSSKVHNVLKPLACIVPVPTAFSQRRLVLALMETVNLNSEDCLKVPRDCT